MAKVEKERISKIVEQLDGLTAIQWRRITQQVDMFYNSKSAKVVLDGSDLEQLESNLVFEFTGERSTSETPLQKTKVEVEFDAESFKDSFRTFLKDSN